MSISSSLLPFPLFFFLLLLINSTYAIYYQWERITVYAYPFSTDRFYIPLGYIPHSNTLVIIGGAALPYYYPTKAISDVYTSDDLGYTWIMRDPAPANGLWGYAYIYTSDQKLCYTGGEENPLYSVDSKRRILDTVYCTDNNGITFDVASWKLPQPMVYHSITITNDNILYLMDSNSQVFTRTYTTTMNGNTNWKLITN